MTATSIPAPPAGAHRAMRADALRNYQRLLTAALESFTEHGADDVSLEEIARRAGVGIGTLYRHFPTRQALVEAVYRDQVEGLRDKAQALLAADAADEALAEWLRALVEFGSTKRSLVRSLMATTDKSAMITACGTVMRASAAALLERAQQAALVRPDADVEDMMRLIHAISIMAAERPPADEGQSGRLVDLVMDGLRYQN